MVIAMVIYVNNNFHAPNCKQLFPVVTPLACRIGGVARVRLLAAHFDISNNNPCVRELMVSLLRGNLLFLQ